jgi:hypothetical protein
LNAIEEVLNEFEEVLKAMDNLGTFLIENVSCDTNEMLTYTCIEYDDDDGMEIDEMCFKLKNVIDITKITEFATYPDDLGSENKTIISFKYNGRKCEIGENFTRNVNYLWINILAIEN